VIRLDVSGYGAPITADRKFVLFLGGYDPRGDWFHIYKPWELQNGAAVPLDPHDAAMAQAGRSQFAGMNEGGFIIAVPDAIQRLRCGPESPFSSRPSLSPCLRLDSNAESTGVITRNYASGVVESDPLGS